MKKLKKQQQKEEEKEKSLLWLKDRELHIIKLDFII